MCILLIKILIKRCKFINHYRGLTIAFYGHEQFPGIVVHDLTGVR